MSLRYKKYPIYGGNIGLVRVLIESVPVVLDRLAAQQAYEAIPVGRLMSPLRLRE